MLNSGQQMARILAEAIPDDALLAAGLASGLFSDDPFTPSGLHPALAAN